MSSIVKEISQRGFAHLLADVYVEAGRREPIVCESSAVGDYEDSLAKPGSSFLHIGKSHLNREEVAELVEYLDRWLKTGRL